MRAYLEKMVSRFGKSERGAVALTAALAVLPMMLVAGSALDFVHASSIKSRLQTSLDAAALAAASSRSLSDGERLKLANAVFAKNWADPMTAGIKATPSFKFDGNGIVATADIDVPTAFMQLAGITSMDIGSEANISIPVTKKAEVALVLDYSESMTQKAGKQVKYIAMKNAAIKLVSDLKAAGKDAAKVGLVPFSNMVRVTLPKEYVKGEVGAGTWTGCTQDRLYPYNISDETPDKDDDKTKWKQSVNENHTQGMCSEYAPRNLTVKPLTTDLDSVKDQLGSMLPLKYTHISLGVEFGWHLLSPNAPFTGVAPYGDEGTQKFLVVLTDGAQTVDAFGKSSRSWPDGEKNLSTLCAAIKKKNVTVVTIAFDLDDDDTVDRLRNCSSDPDKNFFVANDDTDLATAFSEITKQVTAQIYVSK